MDKQILKPIIEKGALVVCLSIAIFVLWKKSENADNDIRQHIYKLEQENQECSSQYRNLLLDQLSISNQIIEKNSVIIKNLESKILSK